MTTSESKVIVPTVGRKVWFRLNGMDRLQPANTPDASPQRVSLVDRDQPLDATVVYAWGGRLVNLAVLDHYGNSFMATSVPLLQEGDEKPARGYYCEWMPYQVGQAKKEAANAVVNLDGYAARARAALACVPPRQTHREAMALAMAPSIASYVGCEMEKAKQIAEAMKTVLDVLAPDETATYRDEGGSVSALHEAMQSGEVRVFTAGKPTFGADPEKFGAAVIDAAVETQGHPRT